MHRMRAFLVGALFTATLAQQSSAASSDPVFERVVQPFLAKHCTACHNEKVKTANLNLTSSNLQAAVWEKVQDKVSTGKMPPAAMPRPGKDELQQVTGWIESQLIRSTTKPDPGRVTARRLNRVEYTNTIRDLLGIEFQAFHDFPVDDSGYGFDNIGDVLTLSPMLMEKYFAAAKEIAQRAVRGEALPPKPTVLAHLATKRSQESGRDLANSILLPYSMRGALYGSWNFPVDAEYELRFRVVNFRAPTRRPTPDMSPELIRKLEEEAKTAFPPMPAVLTLDGKAIKEYVVEGSTDKAYDRGEVVARVPVKAGMHQLRVSYPDLANVDDPRNNLNRDQRRKLFIDYLNIVGPFNPSTKPTEPHQRIFVCNHRQPECARKIVERLASRAYRRPASEKEVNGLLGLVAMAEQKGDSFEDGIQLAVQAVLVSPRFLFRIERDPNPSDPSSSHPISDSELASRLSYFLWSSMPDDELFRLAEQQRLHKPEVLEAEVHRMLADGKSKALVENFAGQWLQLRGLDRAKPDAARFPTFDDELRDAMRHETELFTQAILHEDRSVLDFIDAPFTFLNGPLARHYGITGVSGEEFRRVALNGKQRSGVLTHAGILTISSYANRTSPVIRGKWVLENFLGDAPPPPPPDVPELKESEIGSTGTLRQQLEQHRASPSCSVCHNQMDPLGFGLENYDAIGAWRTHDGKFPLDTTGTLPNGKSFNGPQELKAILKADADAFTRNFAMKMLTYALGRGLERYDRPAVEQIGSRVAQSNYRFSSAVLAIVNSAPFQMRRGDEAH